MRYILSLLMRLYSLLGLHRVAPICCGTIFYRAGHCYHCDHALPSILLPLVLLAVALVLLVFLVIRIAKRGVAIEGPCF
jgi:hypothetical protein